VHADLQRIAGREPRPIGSAGGNAIRDYLVAVLSAAGFSVEVQTGLGSWTFGAATAAGRVDNVVAAFRDTPRPGRSYWLPITTRPSGPRAQQMTRHPSRLWWRRHARLPAADRYPTTSSWCLPTGRKRLLVLPLVELALPTARSFLVPLVAGVSR
jgi:hypothetical protein